MAQHEFRVSCQVAGPPAAVIDFLTDLANHHGLHPYLVEATAIADGDSPSGPFRQWRVLERPRLGPLRYPIRFGARLTRTSPTSFVSSVRAAPGCTIEAITTAEPGPSPGTASIHEYAIVRAPRAVVGYMSRQAELAHRRTMRLLPDAFVAHGSR